VLLTTARSYRRRIGQAGWQPASTTQVRDEIQSMVEARVVHQARRPRPEARAPLRRPARAPWPRPHHPRHPLSAAVTPRRATVQEGIFSQEEWVQMLKGFQAARAPARARATPPGAAPRAALSARGSTRRADTEDLRPAPRAQVNEDMALPMSADIQDLIVQVPFRPGPRTRPYKPDGRLPARARPRTAEPRCRAALQGCARRGGRGALSARARGAGRSCGGSSRTRLRTS